MEVVNNIPDNEIICCVCKRDISSTGYNTLFENGKTVFKCGLPQKSTCQNIAYKREQQEITNLRKKNYKLEYDSLSKEERKYIKLDKNEKLLEKYGIDISELSYNIMNQYRDGKMRYYDETTGECYVYSNNCLYKNYKYIRTSDWKKI